jgi:hypothetical protein
LPLAGDVVDPERNGLRHPQPAAAKSRTAMGQDAAIRDGADRSAMKRSRSAPVSGSVCS